MTNAYREFLNSKKNFKEELYGNNIGEKNISINHKINKRINWESY